MLPDFQKQVSVPNQHPALKVPWLTLQAATNHSPQAELDGDTHVSLYWGFFEIFLLRHCHLKIFMHMKSVFTVASFLLQSCIDINIHFMRLLHNVISRGILQFTVSTASQFYTVRATGVAYTLLLLLWTACYCQHLHIYHRYSHP